MLTKLDGNACRSQSARFAFPSPSSPVGPSSRAAHSLRRTIMRPVDRSGVVVHAKPEEEFAVFRFTLGNDALDSQVPRIVSVVVSALLVVNHVFSESPTEAQSRTEALAGILAAICFIAPSLDERLKDAEAGRGRKAPVEQIAGATNVFGLSDAIKDNAKKELAWASFSILKNSNSCAVIAYDATKEEVLMCRGAIASAAATGASTAEKLRSLTAAVRSAVKGSSDVQSLAAGGSTADGRQIVMADKLAMTAAGATGWGFVCEGIESMAVFPVVGAEGGKARGLLIVLSERPRALSKKERGWVGAAAEKLASVM